MLSIETGMIEFMFVLQSTRNTPKMAQFYNTTFFLFRNKKI